MKQTRLIALASTAALLFAANVPAMSATTKTATITVKWNTQAIANLVVNTDYNNTGAFNGGTTAGAILLNANTGAGTCTATDPTNQNGINDFGNVSPDFAQFTDCEYKNAANAQVSTNSTSWNLGVAATAGYPGAGYAICAEPNGVTFGSAGAAAMAATVSGRATATSITSTAACPAGDVLMNAAGTATNLINTNTHSFTAASPANVGMDIVLVMANNAATGPQSVTETYTLTAN
jgi:hypothetical protein